MRTCVAVCQWENHTESVLLAGAWRVSRLHPPPQTSRKLPRPRYKNIPLDCKVSWSGIITAQTSSAVSVTTTDLAPYTGRAGKGGAALLTCSSWGVLALTSWTAEMILRYISPPVMDIETLWRRYTHTHRRTQAYSWTRWSLCCFHRICVFVVHFSHLTCDCQLIQCKADPNTFNEHGNTPLHYACFWGQDEVAEVQYHTPTDRWLLLAQYFVLKCPLLGKNSLCSAFLIGQWGSDSPVFTHLTIFLVIFSVLDIVYCLFGRTWWPVAPRCVYVIDMVRHLWIKQSLT